MINKKNKNLFSFMWISSLIILLFVCFFGFIFSLKGTRSYFGDPSGTGSLGGEIYSVYYYRNWPNIGDTEYVENKKYNITMILDISDASLNFAVIDGYRFDGWNTKADGSGISFDVGYTFPLTADLNLYAQWNLIVSYGDVNEDGVISEDDYLLIENYITGDKVLDHSALLNADVNADGKVDLIDADIVKQACLGTPGYVGYLPNSPISIYDIYEGNIDVGTDTSDGGSDNSDGDINQDGGGTGEIGNGNGSSGNSQGSSSSSGGGGSGSSSNNNSNSSDIVDNDIEDGDNKDNSGEDVDDSKKEFFEFKFMNGNVEYSSTICEVDDETCLLVLPDISPSVSGYRFTGWSLSQGCPEKSGIINSIYVDSSATYYACFVESDTDNNNNKYLWIIVFGICVIAIRLIWYLIINFRNNKKVDVD